LNLTIARGKPALILHAKDGTYLLVADIHLGAAVAAGYSYQGASQEALEIAGEMNELGRKYGCNKLVILGDIKHSYGKPTRVEGEEIVKFVMSLSKEFSVWLVRGNHDSGVDEYLGGRVLVAGKEGLLIGDVLLVHGHSIPTEFNMHGTIIMGHVHPHVQEGEVLSPAWIVYRNKKRLRPGKIVLMPHFNSYLTRIRYSPGDAYRLAPILRRVKLSDFVMQSLTLENSKSGVRL
jgi:putative SbcD/Mre11-related phosphoesterase